MISAIVLIPDGWPADDLGRTREIVVRSMVWLVSAVVSGVVRDVVLAVPPGFGFAELADQSGCTLVQAKNEAERLASAAGAARAGRVLVLRAGFQPETGLVEDLDAFLRREPQAATALVLATPATALQRLFPEKARVVGVLLPKPGLSLGGGIAALVRRTRRGATRLQARARPIG